MLNDNQAGAQGDLIPLQSKGSICLLPAQGFPIKHDQQAGVNPKWALDAFATFETAAGHLSTPLM